MKPAGDRLASDLAKADVRVPKIPVLANATGEPHPADADGIRELLEKQVSSPVYWENCVRWMLGRGATKFYEPAPGDVLAGLMKKIEPSAVVVAGPA
jgi:[acyl-carrier-protein] S-malonyltransferase